MDTIEIRKALFNDMVTSLLKEVKVDEQVQWLQTYGSNFYTLGLYEYVMKAHSITDQEYTDGAVAFWEAEPILFKEVSCGVLLELMQDALYEKHVSFSYTTEKKVSDIALGLEPFEKNPDSTYYSPCLFKCIIAQLKLDTSAVFSFTKAILNAKVSVVFVVQSANGLMAFDLTRDPT